MRSGNGKHFGRLDASTCLSHFGITRTGLRAALSSESIPSLQTGADSLKPGAVRPKTHDEC